VAGNLDWITESTRRLQDAGIIVSLFIDPDEKQIDAAGKAGAEYIEMHTGAYANTVGAPQEEELQRLIKGAGHADSIGLNVNAGHGIDYMNIDGILKIPFLKELNIGHSIVARAVIVGMFDAVKEMNDLMAPYSL
jgi:pyridoxine 5-phosphate synthase